VRRETRDGVEWRIRFQDERQVLTVGKRHEAGRPARAKLGETPDGVCARGETPHVEEPAPAIEERERIPPRTEDRAMRRPDREPLVPGRNNEGENTTAGRVLLRVGDRGLVAMMAVGDVQRTQR